jgi:serine/threonine-protein kinase
MHPGGRYRGDDGDTEGAEPRLGSSKPEDTLDCLSENTFQQFLDRTLSEARIRDTEMHLDTCRSCRELLSTLALGMKTPAGPQPDEPGSISPAGAVSAMPHSMAPGTRVGRFIVQSPLGVGGMGMVYAADDPLLRRKVALKLIHADHSDGPAGEAWRARLLREARAIARLSHPNVITVHEIGLHGDQPFVAMELVEGSTLRSWLAASPRSWRDIVSVFVAAGRGLLAAHRGGLVHRDFKADNVLIGHDGRIRVTDFGLACPLPGVDRRGFDGLAPEEPRATLGPPGSDVEEGQERLTRTGVLVGTPGYIAPEVLRGGAADFASDQFSFCVALHEALFRERPLERKPATRVRGDRHAVPGWLQQTVRRGLSARPADRFPSMENLLTALNREPIRRRRIQLGAAAAVVIAVGVAASVVAAGKPDPEICTGALEQVSGVWNPGMAARVRSSFAATARPHAQASADRVAEGVTRYTGQWATMHRAACLATLRGEQSPNLLDRRMACLGRRLAQVGALLDIFAHRADERLADDAVQLVANLEPLATCMDSTALLASTAPPADPLRRARLAELERQTDGADLERQAGRPQVAADGARAVLDAVREIDYAPLAAQAGRVLGRSLEELGQPAEAREALIRAHGEAERAGDVRLAAHLLIDLVLVVGVREQRHSEARLVGQLAQAALEKSELRGDQAMRARMLEALGSLANDEGQIDRAIELLTEMLAIRRRSSAPPVDVASAESRLGSALSSKGRAREARAHYLEALAIRSRVLGDDHPLTAMTHGNLGATAMEEDGNTAEARKHFLTQLAVFERIPTHVAYPSLLSNLGTLESSVGNHDKAREYHERALNARRSKLGPEHPQVATSLHNLGDVYSDTGDLAKALSFHRQALAIREKTLGKEHPTYAYTLSAIGEDIRGSGHPREALVYLEQALAILRPRVGKNLVVGYTLAYQGEALLDLGRRRDAIPKLEEALEMIPPTYRDHAHAAFALARSLDPDRPTSVRARTLAEKALKIFTTVGATPERERVAGYLAKAR